MPRIVSLIASATEIVCALGFEGDIVARSHECDYPESIKELPICTEPKFNVHGTSAEIDSRVKTILQDATSVYRVDVDLLKALRPDVIVTQSHCEVCAVSERDVELALAEWLDSKPTVVSLAPNSLADVWQGMRQVAEALGVPERGEALVDGLVRRIDGIAARARNGEAKPTVACLEWLDPLMAGGNWVPELVELAGGVNLFGEAGKHSPWMTWEALCQKDPDIIIALPCGLDLERTRQEMKSLTERPEWPSLRAVRSGRVFITDGNQYFNRPGPRLVESLEIFAEIFHPGTFDFGHEDRGWAQLTS